MAAEHEKAICDRFGIEKLVDNQKLALSELIKGRDVFMAVKTGGGKSLVYQSYPLALPRQQEDRCRVLIISPLVSIMREQTDFLQSLEFSAAYIGSSEDSDKEILAGNVQFIYSSPESILQNEKWRSHLSSSTDNKLLVIDEAHTVLQWSDKTTDQPFREWYGNIGELRSLVKCPMLVLTATISKSARRKLKKKLALIDCCEIIESPDRSNVKLYVKKVNSASPLLEVFSWIVEEVQEKAESATRYLLFANTIAKCSQIMTMFQINLTKDRLKHVNMFHSCTPDDVKERIRTDMDDANGEIRILIATSAAGMGVNYKGLYNIIHFGPPKEMDSFVQQLGRAGRDGKQSCQLLLYNSAQLGYLRPKFKYEEMHQYAENVDRCRRDLLLESYNAVKQPSQIAHTCCDICAKDCDCGQSDCEINKLPHVNEIPDYVESDHESDGLWDSSDSFSESDVVDD